MYQIKTACECGQVKGAIEEHEKRKGSRLICYCKDCQTFAHFLGKADQILNPQGGTEVYQIAPSQLRIEQGIEHVSCVRLSPKGLFRWYTSCCNTPLGNTVSGSVPFVGLVHMFISTDVDKDAMLGPLRMSIEAKAAKGQPQESNVHDGVPFSLLAKTIVTLALRAITGQAKPNPFFNDAGEPAVAPTILSKEQRKQYSNQ